ncbi:MAG: DUF3098 domain-containing protein [Bacteroidia bacterium]|nr:DUF3098 domain-containing protein [Bacteroidia bacterium]MCX7763864.1 DUF3098 domain-containing protein [Bacteroidia bacterium]MDW8057701.1 DUF3098 domain-containing protein [Bacteroidia bacterium]
MSTEKKVVNAPRNPSPAKEPSSEMPFTRANYQWLIIGVILLIIGYIGLLIPPRFVDSKQFSVALYVAPWFILGGFGTLIYAILKK